MSKLFTNILTDPPQLNHAPVELPQIDVKEFEKVIETRRSVRVFDSAAPIPPEVTRRCLELALLAPNSSNLQPWEFYWVRSPEKKAKLATLCMSQSAARTAQELIVCVARTSTWKRSRAQMLAYFSTQPKTPKGALDYYQKLVPFVYTQGFFGILGFLKWILVSVIGFFKVIPRGPFGNAALTLWATKTVSLACENLMLAFRAHGFDTCPMEGFDEVRTKRLLNIPSDGHVVMVIGAGKRKPEGVYGPQVRFSSNQYLFEV